MRRIALLLSAVLAIAPVEGATRRHIVGRHSPEPPYDVTVNVTSGSALQATAAIDAAAADRVRWVRIPITWSVIQPTSSTFADLRFYGPLIARAAQDDLQVLGVLCCATEWNTTAPATETRAAQREHYPPADYDAWSRFVSFVVTTYKSNIHAWEIWNEPDLGSPVTQPCDGFWCGSAAQYAELLAVSYKAIKAADPNATVLFGSLALSQDANPDFFADVFFNPAKPQFDAVGLYAFGSKTEVQRRVSFMKTQLLYSGAGLRDLWISFGYSSDPAAQNIAPYYGGEPGQVAYLNDMSAYLLNLGAKRLFWYELFDSDPAHPAYGLMTSALAKKQSYDAYGALIKSFPNY